MEEQATSFGGKVVSRPPLYTLLCEVVGWTLGRTADIPKNGRFTFGQRLDSLALDALPSVVKAVFSPDAARKQEYLSDLLLELEQMQVLRRLAQERCGFSHQQRRFTQPSGPFWPGPDRAVAGPQRARNLSAHFGAPGSQLSIPTALAQPICPGTAPKPHRGLTVASP